MDEVYVDGDDGKVGGYNKGVFIVGLFDLVVVFVVV